MKARHLVLIAVAGLVAIVGVFAVTATSGSKKRARTRCLSYRRARSFSAEKKAS
jgi:hypothetical protein